MHNQLIQYLTHLVKINSVNPELSSDGQGEQEIGECVNRHFQALGISSKVHTITGDRCNTTAFIPGHNPDKILNIGLNNIQITIRPDQKVFYNFYGHLSEDRFELIKKIINKFN